ncbi:MAG: hypothetical protein ACREQL_07720, partial [Candidatus Binatia bacterium]
ILAARIDRLGEREKTVLQTGAVIGKEFPESILRRVVDLEEADLASALRALVAAEFFYEEALYPEPIYAFKHPLTQEVAYRSQLGERRRQLHTDVARAIEDAYPTKLGEQAALLAQHWEAAGEPLVAATWHQRAADWIGVRDRAETLRHWTEIRRLLATVPASPETLALGVMARDAMMLHGLFCGMSDEEAETLFTEGMDLAKRLPEPSSRIGLLTRLGSRKSLTGVPAEALAPLEEARRLAVETGDPFLEFMTRFAMLGAAMNLGRLEDAIVHFDHCEAVCGGDPEYGTGITGFSVHAYLLAMRGFVLGNQGHWTEALRFAERAIEIARERRDHEMLVIGGAVGCTACEMIGDAPGALAHARGAMRATEAGAEGIRQTAMMNLGRAHLMQREWRVAIDTLTASLSETRKARTGLALEAMILALLAAGHLGAGDLASARETADEAVAVARRRKTRVVEIVALLARVRVLLATDGASPAVERDLDDATALIQATTARGYLPFVHVERARLAALRGDASASRHHAGEARRLFSEMGGPARAEQTARELER